MSATQPRPDCHVEPLPGKNRTPTREGGFRSPLIQLWFGHFFHPWLSNRERVAAALDEIRDLGFNAINLDSKSWADFFARCRGEPASPYVAMQEFMMAEARRRGPAHSSLAVCLLPPQHADMRFPRRVKRGMVPSGVSPELEMT